MHSYGILFAILLISTYFFIAALVDIKLWRSSIQMMKSKNIPFTSLALIAAIILKLACSILLFFPHYSLYAALGLIAFTLICNFIFNGFWREAGEARYLTLLRFLANLSIIGGLILVVLV